MDSLDNGIAAVSTCPRDDSLKLSSSILINVDDKTELLIPAPIDDDLAEEIRHLAVKAVVALEGRGLARVDFLLDRNSGEVFVNEVNSIPGFTKGSMYPLLWQASGVPYPALLDRLIELALERHRISSALVTRYEPTR